MDERRRMKRIALALCAAAAVLVAEGAVHSPGDGLWNRGFSFTESCAGRAE